MARGTKKDGRRLDAHWLLLRHFHGSHCQLLRWRPVRLASDVRSRWHTGVARGIYSLRCNRAEALAEKDRPGRRTLDDVARVPRVVLNCVPAAPFAHLS